MPDAERDETEGLLGEIPVSVDEGRNPLLPIIPGQGSQP